MWLYRIGIYSFHVYEYISVHAVDGQWAFKLTSRLFFLLKMVLHTSWCKRLLPEGPSSSKCVEILKHHLNTLMPESPDSDLIALGIWTWKSNTARSQMDIWKSETWPEKSSWSPCPLPLCRLWLMHPWWFKVAGFIDSPRRCWSTAQCGAERSLGDYLQLP